MEVVRMIEDCGTTSGEPTKRVQIAECGQIPDESEKNEEEDGEEEEEEEEEEERRKRKAGDEQEGEEEGEREGGRREKKRTRVRFAKSDGGAASKRDAKGDEESK